MSLVAAHRRNRKALLALLLTGFIAACPFASAASSVEQEVTARLDRLRTIQVLHDEKALDAANRQMDETWRFFSGNKQLALPIIRERLTAEMKLSVPNDLLLLDTGWFLYINGDPDEKKLSRQALFALHPDAEIVRANMNELFDFTRAVSRDHDPRVLDFIRKTFLSKDNDVIVPQHAMVLHGTLECAFLYGAYGPDAEAYLRTQMRDKSLSKRVMEVLAWIGSPESIPDIKAAFAATPDDDTFKRVVAFMMESGGPDGRTYMLSLDPKTLSPKSRSYLGEIHGSIEQYSFQSVRKAFAQLPGDTHLSDSEVKLRLSAMIKNDGRDDRTSPIAILDSTLPRDFLIEQLVQVRTHSFNRLSDEALDDIQVTNRLINGLRYRSK